MNNTPALLQKNITDSVIGSISRLKDEGLTIAPHYNPTNALKSAFFALTNAQGGNLLEKCTQDSIANALLDMVVQGLNPSKTQCYFVPYGDQLKMTRSYFGTQKVVKSLSEVDDIWAQVIFKDDVFDYEIVEGRERLIDHKTSLENRDKEILGAYAIVKTNDQGNIMTVMTKKEIEASWSQSRNKNVQNKFPQEMAKRTVINRAAKSFINTSDDSDALIEAINRTTSNEFEDEDRIDVTGSVENVQQEIEQNANSEELDFTEGEIADPFPIQEEVQEEPKQANNIKPKTENTNPSFETVLPGF